MSGAPAERYAFRCSACGKCCNSPPAMTLDELFHHERRFIGCLTVQEAPAPLPAGARLGGVAIPEATAAEWRQLHEALCVTHAGRPLRLATRAYDYPSLGRCPALQDDGACAIHHDRKPGMCQAVPLEPELPDGLQRIVLHRRTAEAAYFGAACLQTDGPEADALVAGERVVASAGRQALDRQRRQRMEEAQDWGRPLAARLAPALAAALQGRSLSAGHLTLSLVPVLALRSARSAQARRRCIDYARAQVELIDAGVDAALVRRDKADRAVTTELRRFAAQYRAFAAADG